MNTNNGTVRLAVIDDDSGFLRVLARRFDAAGWEYRVAGHQPAAGASSWR